MKPKRPRRRLNPDTVLLIRHIIIGVMVVSFVSLLILSVWYGTRVEALTIRSVTVSGGETIPHTTISERVERSLEGTYLGLIPKRFAFLYPKADIQAAVGAVERMNSLRVTRTDFNTLSVTFTEYIPDSLWCDDADTKCTFLDSTGYSFAPAPQLRGGAFMRFEKVGTAPIIGVQAFEKDSYETAHELVSVLEDVGWFIERIEVDAANDAYAMVVGGGEFKVSLNHEPVSVVENLLTVLTATEFSHIEAGNFEYIDLRFGNKVYVKELEPEPEPEPEPVIVVPPPVEREAESSPIEDDEEEIFVAPIISEEELAEEDEE